jgi:NHS family nucleoside permease-like MFS transporter
MTNGVGASLGMIAAQTVVNGIGDWPTIWYVFAAYALVIGITFALVFNPEKK